VGLGIYDNLCQPLYDREFKKEYEAFTCINDDEMAKRCIVDNAPKKIYSVKAYAQFNSDCAVNFKDCLKKGKIKFLINENECKDYLNSFKGFSKLPPEVQLKFQSPYLNTTLLISEMVNLEADINHDTGLIKLKEPRTGRKDRWSAVSYGNFFASMLEKDLLKDTTEQDLSLIPSCVSNINIKL
jgi:hypothetical protein